MGGAFLPFFYDDEDEGQKQAVFTVFATPSVFVSVFEWQRKHSCAARRAPRAEREHMRVRLLAYSRVWRLAIPRLLFGMHPNLIFSFAPNRPKFSANFQF